MSRLTKIVALVVLALWGLAAMHCKLEALPGLDFLKSCCFVEAEPSTPKDCDTDGCGAVEDGDYRAEEQSASVPQPHLILARLTAVMQAPLPVLHAQNRVGSESPPDLPKTWRFSQRTALSPRAPSIAS